MLQLLLSNICGNVGKLDFFVLGVAEIHTKKQLLLFRIEIAHRTWGDRGVV